MGVVIISRWCLFRGSGSTGGGRAVELTHVIPPSVCCLSHVLIVTLQTVPFPQRVVSPPVDGQSVTLTYDEIVAHFKALVRTGHHADVLCRFEGEVVLTEVFHSAWKLLAFLGEQVVSSFNQSCPSNLVFYLSRKNKRKGG